MLLAERHKEMVKREDRRAGEIVALLFNVNRDTERVPDGIVWQDVFPEWKEPTKPQTEDELFGAMQAWVMVTEGLSNQHS